MNQHDRNHYYFKRQDDTPGKFVEDDDGAWAGYAIIIVVAIICLLL